MFYISEVKNRLKEIRRNLKLTQTQLAELTESSLQMIQYLEGGQRQLTPKWMEKISTVLKIEPWMLWVDPSAVISAEEREIISRYNALNSDARKKIDQILFPKPKK